jgi:hypothetical protein
VPSPTERDAEPPAAGSTAATDPASSPAEPPATDGATSTPALDGGTHAKAPEAAARMEAPRDATGSTAPTPDRALTPWAPRETSPRAPLDVMYVHGPTESGDGLHVLRQRADRIEVGQIRGLREGAPIHGEVVRLRPRADGERLFDVEVLLEQPRRQERGGPPQIATNAYRHNWDAVFGGAAGPKKGHDPEPN